MQTIMTKQMAQHWADNVRKHGRYHQVGTWFKNRNFNSARAIRDANRSCGSCVMGEALLALTDPQIEQNELLVKLKERASCGQYTQSLSLVLPEDLVTRMIGANDGLSKDCPPKERAEGLARFIEEQIIPELPDESELQA